MSLLDDSSKREVKKSLSSMQSDVNILFFEDEGEFVNETKELLKDINEINPKVKINFYKVGDDISNKYEIKKGPVIKMMGEHIKGDLRMYGIPSGYEFQAFLEMLKIASIGKINGSLLNISEKIKNKLKLEVFVSPNCPYCPSSIIVAFKLAMLNEKVEGYIYEVLQSQEEVKKYKVNGVPKTIINEGKHEYMGGLSEDMASKEILKTI
jgi:glutaredoxin-like protein